MNTTTHRVTPWVWSAALLVVVLIIAAATTSMWLPHVKQLWADQVAQNDKPGSSENHDDHAGHDHGHQGHSEATSVHLSERGLKNIDYRPLTIELGTYSRRVTLPAMVVERPGRTLLNISAPLTGVIKKIYPVEGASVEPGSPLFEIRLTHEELVTAQSDLIRTAEALIVVNRELARLSGLPEGVVAGKRILEQEYEKQKLEASLRAERQSLRLHGLNEQQVGDILENKTLLETLVIRAPEHQHKGDESCSESHSYHVQKLPTRVGQQVQAGELLGVIADHCELYVEGRAFEDDAVRLREAAKQQWDISASLLVAGKEADRVNGLKVLFLSDHIDPQSRAFRFFLTLPNEIVSERNVNNQDFVEWRFKPGQRMELHVPVEKWEEEIVVPVEAVVEEGAEKYVYQQNGDHFDQVPVHVKFRDQTSVVVANDGALFPGDVIAARGAYEMHLTLKNQSGGGVDPHAGHNH